MGSSSPPPLPQYVVLTTGFTKNIGSKRPLLSRRRETKSIMEPKNRLEFIYTEANQDPTVKFAIEESSSFNNEQLVHIRCCDNNKYLVRRREFPNPELLQLDLIDATAAEPEEDTSVWTCTLFKPEYQDYGSGHNYRTAYRFRHVQTGTYITSTMNYTGRCYLSPHINGIEIAVDLDIIDWSSIVTLPTQVVFKGDNDKYLAVVRHPNGSPNLSGIHGYTLQFSKDDPADISVKHDLEVISNNHDGALYIKGLNSQSYWYSATQFSPPRPMYLSDRYRASYYTPVKVDPNTIGIRTPNRRFVRRSPTQNDYLYHDGQSLIRDTRIRVEEPVLKREIFNVRYRLEDARIYDETPIAVTSTVAENNQQVENSKTLSVTHKEQRERYWRASVSLQLGIKMEIRFGVPLIINKKIEVEAAISGEYEWGEKQTETLEQQLSYTVPVPPMTLVTVRAVASRGTCDVPFEYTVRDVLMDGTTRIYRIDGGVFTGVNNFNFHIVPEFQPL